MVRFLTDVLPGVCHVIAFRPGYPHLSSGCTRFVLAGARLGWLTHTGP